MIVFPRGEVRTWSDLTPGALFGVSIRGETHLGVKIQGGGDEYHCALLRGAIRIPRRSSHGFRRRQATSLGVSWGARRRIFFANLFDVSFGLLACLVDVLAHLGNVLIIARRLYVDDKAPVIGCADDPPIRERRIDEGKQKKNGYQ